MANKTRKEFSKRFRQALNEAGHTKTQLNELGSFFEVSAQAVRKWLNGESLPNSSRAPQIAMQLGVRRAWLLDGELPMRTIELKIQESSTSYAAEQQDHPITISSDEYRLLLSYRKLPQDIQTSALALLDGIYKEQKSK